MISEIREYLSKYSIGQKASFAFVILYGGKIIFDYIKFLPDISKMLEKAPEYTQEEIAKIAIANFWLTFTLIAILLVGWLVPIAGKYIGYAIDIGAWYSGRDVERYRPDRTLRFNEGEENAE